MTDRQQQALDKMAENARELGLDYEPAQQEPPTVAELLCVCGAEWEWRNRDWELVATPPASKPWVGLTDEEIQKEFHPLHATGLQFARSIEAKLREKNA